MKLIIGLGNPGLGYEKTRHNVGFIAIDSLCKNLNFIPFKKDNKFHAEISTGDYEDTKVILAKPLTYMNKSGEAALKLINYYKISPNDCIVLCDDLDTELGKIRIRKKGGPGTHNGLKSIAGLIGDEYQRIKIGVENRSPEMINKINAAAYVLGNFSNKELEKMETTIDRITEASKLIILDEIDEAMNKFN